MAQALIELHRLGLLRAQQGLQFLTAATALLLLLHPAARAASHFCQAAAGELNGCFSAAAGLIGLLALLRVVGGLQLLALLLQFSALLLLVVALLLQLRGLLLVALSAALQLAASGFQLSQLALHRNQLVFAKAFDGLLQPCEFFGSTFELLLALDQGLLF